MTEKTAYRLNWIFGSLIVILITTGIYMDFNPKKEVKTSTSIVSNPTDSIADSIFNADSNKRYDEFFKNK